MLQAGIHLLLNAPLHDLPEYDRIVRDYGAAGRANEV